MHLFYQRSQLSHITNITLRHHLKGLKKRSGEECIDMAVHHQMRECLEFYHQQRAGEQGESQARHSFYCLHLRLGSKGGHCCLSADLCCLDFPPLLTRSPSAFFLLAFFCVNGCSFFFHKRYLKLPLSFILISKARCAKSWNKG